MCRVVCANILINGTDDDGDVLMDLFAQSVHCHKGLISSHANSFPP